jgi:uncharacterized protein (DUF433 family)
MPSTKEPIDLLARPVYSMAQVDWLLGLSPGTARRWIDGYTRDRRQYPPIVRLYSTGEDIVTWGEFTEARLLSEFREAGATIFRLRPAVDRLRQEFDAPYPLAYARPWLDSVGKELVFRVQQEVDLDKRLQIIVVRNEQYMLSFAADQFVRSADFDERIVKRIRPLAAIEDVWLDPLRQFGQPVVRSVPTEVIAEQFRAGDDLRKIAELHDLSEGQVLQAIRYELWRGREERPAA